MVLEEVQREIRKLRDAELSYGKIGKLYGVNKGIIHRVLNQGYEPKDEKLRKRLGLDGPTIGFIRQIRGQNGTFVKNGDS